MTAASEPGPARCEASAPLAHAQGARPLRILHVYRTAWPQSQGGTEEFIRTLGAEHVRAGFEVTVLHPSAQVRCVGSELAEGVRVVRVPELFEIASCNVFLRGLGTFRRLCRSADILHYHFPWPFADLLHLLAEPRPRLPCVLTYHSDIVRQQRLGSLYAPLMRRFLRSVDRVVATSEPYAQGSSVLRTLPRPPAVIPIGIDARRLREPSPGLLADWRARVGEGFFFFIGVLRYYKGLDVLLRAVAGTRLRVVIAGEGPEGARLRALAQELGAGNVVFAGRVSDEDKAALFTLCRAFVFPSNRRSEAYGIALLEALAWGRAAVSTDPGTGVGFLNRDGLTGLNVAPDDPEALRAAMLRLADDEALCARLGAAGRARARGELGSAAMAAAYTALYTELHRDAAVQAGALTC